MLFSSKQSFLFFRGCLCGLALISLAAVAGCGGGSSSSTEGTTVTTSSLSKAAFVKKANAICDRSTQTTLTRLGAYEKKHPNGDPSTAFGRAIKSVAPGLIEPQIEQIRKLGAPAGDEEQVEAFLVALQTDLEGLRNAPPMGSPEELGVKFAHSSALATNLGLTSCAYAG